MKCQRKIDLFGALLWWGLFQRVGVWVDTWLPSESPQGPHLKARGPTCQTACLRMGVYVCVCACAPSMFNHRVSWLCNMHRKHPIKRAFLRRENNEMDPFRSFHSEQYPNISMAPLIKVRFVTCSVVWQLHWEDNTASGRLCRQLKYNQFLILNISKTPIYYTPFTFYVQWDSFFFFYPTLC